MSRGLVLVIEDDEEVSRELAGRIRAAGLEPVERRTAKAGLDAACSMEPDAIVCSVDLPDADGYWLARNVRMQSSRVSVTPFLFLSASDDEDSRLQGFHVGADVTMTKPYRMDEVVAQVRALVHMAERLRERRDSLAVPSSRGGAAIEGDLAQLSLATILTVLDMERRTGLFQVVSKKRVAHLQIVGGSVLTGAIGGTRATPTEVVRTVLGWNVGRFSFRGRPDRPRPADLPTIAGLLLEAARMEDEAVRDEAGGPRSSRRLPELAAALAEAPSFGGPPASVRETKPPLELGPASSRGPSSSARGNARRTPLASRPEEPAPSIELDLVDDLEANLDEPASEASPATRPSQPHGRPATASAPGHAKGRATHGVTPPRPTASSHGTKR
jgi:DNA-binding response OmpR family regulator